MVIEGLAERNTSVMAGRIPTVIAGPSPAMTPEEARPAMPPEDASPEIHP
jgi:hypothetical protein